MGPQNISDFDALDILGTIIIVLVSSISVTVGLGGGGLYTPVLIILMGYNTHEATALSQSLMFGATIGAFIFNIRGKHPLVNRPLLDLELIIFMAPLQVSGVNIGVIINRLIPSYIIATILLLVLIFTIQIVIKKTIQQLKKDKNARLEAEKIKKSLKNPSPQPITDTQSIAPMPLKSDITSEDNTEKCTNLVAVQTEIHISNDSDSAVFHISESEKSLAHPFIYYKGKKYTADYFYKIESRYSIWQILTLIGFWILSLAFSFIRGVTGPLQVVETCSWEYWLIFSINIATFFIGSALFGYFYLIKTQHLKKVVGYVFIDGDIQYTPIQLIKIGFQSFMAGIFAGIVGVGGGIILSPLLLTYNIVPQVVTSVNALLILFSSSSASLSLLSSGYTPLDVAALLAILCAISSFIGKYVIDALVRHYKATSLLLILLMIIISLSVASILGISIYDLVTGQAQQGGLDLLCNTPN